MAIGFCAEPFFARRISSVIVLFFSSVDSLKVTWREFELHVFAAHEIFVGKHGGWIEQSRLARRGGWRAKRSWRRKVLN